MGINEKIEAYRRGYLRTHRAMYLALYRQYAGQEAALQLGWNVATSHAM